MGPGEDRGIVGGLHPENRDDAALDLSKRHSGIVATRDGSWDCSAEGGEEIAPLIVPPWTGGEPPQPHARAMPGATQLTVNSPMMVRWIY